MGLEMNYRKKYRKNHIIKGKRVAALLMVVALGVLSACGISRGQADTSTNAEAHLEVSKNLPEQENFRNLSRVGLSGFPDTSGQKGTFTGEEAAQLSSEHEVLLREYMDTYYESLSKLQVKELSHLFLEEASDQVLMNESAIAYVTGLRSMQETDLHLVDYRYDMEVTLIQTVENMTEVQLIETSTQNFAQHPDVDSILYNIRHVFQLCETAEGWKIAEHWQRDSIYRNLLGNYWNWEDKQLTMSDASAYFSEQVDLLLTNARQELFQRINSGGVVTEPSVDHAYQREAAVAYSSTWIGQRNTDWSDYTGRGGNCQNFVSQCLLAGGIPMDDQGHDVWIWNSEGNHSASWVGVDEFYYYASQNRGYGLQAMADALYDEGELGDLIRMGNETDWNHVVIISEILRNQDGNVVDYLINSNTSDVKNFPVSAYPTQKQRLMKIYGWNER